MASKVHIMILSKLLNEVTLSVVEASLTFSDRVHLASIPSCHKVILLYE